MEYRYLKHLAQRREASRVQPQPRRSTTLTGWAYGCLMPQFLAINSLKGVKWKMITISFNDALGGGWKERFRSLVRTLQHLKPHRTSGKSAPAVCEKMAELQRAVLTFRMAANPGENYEVVAARIEREAASYKAFLQNPQPIGKIALNVKQLLSNADESDASYSQYQVNEPSEREADPAEGRAMVSYTYNRARPKVLEFIVYDEKGEPLFPIVRTYSDWLGSRNFDLGLNRIFYLNMVESDSRGYVTVQAGFRPLALWTMPVAITKEKRKMKKIDACTTCNDTQSNNGRQAIFATGRLLVASAPGLAVMLICCLIMGTVINTKSAGVGHLTPAPNHAPQAAQADHHVDMEPEVEARNSATGLEATEHVHAITTPETHEATGEIAIAVKSAPTSVKRAHHQSAQLQKTIRMAGITKLNLSVDRASCDATRGRCQELLTNLQEEMEATLSSLNFPVSTHGELHAGEPAVWLVVSYKEMKGQHGHVSLTLYDEEGRLWNQGQDYHKDDAADPAKFAITSSSQFAKQLVQEIIKAKDEVKDKEGEQT